MNFTLLHSFVLLNLVCFSLNLSYSQIVNPDHLLINKNNVTYSKSTITIYDQNQHDSIHYLISTSTYNSLGYPLVQTNYKNEGNVSGKTQYKYRFDTLVLQINLYNEKNELSGKELFKYNSSGKPKSRSIVNKHKGNNLDIYYLYDDLDRLTKMIAFKNGLTFYYNVWDYDNNNNKLRQHTYNQKDELMETYLYEYDGANNLINSYKLGKGIKTVLEENKYNLGNQKTGTSVYYSSPTTLINSNGWMAKMNTGDKKTTHFTYNEMGLISEETDLVNEVLKAKIKYEYSTK